MFDPPTRAFDAGSGKSAAPRERTGIAQTRLFSP